MQKELGDDPSCNARNKFKTDWIQRMFPDEYIANHCFLCEYAGTDGCSKCPIDWGNVQVDKWRAQCTGDNTDYLTSPISEILALPEKDEKAAYDITEKPSPDVVIRKDLGHYDYTSPLELITREISSQMYEDIDSLAITAIKEIGLLVDEEELIRALNYDRQQYEKGYADGLKAAREKEV